MKKLLSKFKVNKNKYPEGYTPIEKYIVFMHDSHGFNLKEEYMTQSQLETCILHNRENIRHIFEYVDRVVIRNELVEIEGGSDEKETK